MPQPPFAALFDWDGVILDSSAHHEASWERLAQEIARPLPEGHFKAGFGRKNEFIIPNILGWSSDPGEIARLSDRKEALYRDIVAERGVAPLPGVETWLARLAEAGIPCVIGSSTHRANIALALPILGLERFFAGIVTAEDVSQGKPHPEVFLKAAARAGVAPERSVVFEDAFVGIEAARAGGMKVVAVASTHPASALGMADAVVHRLDELTIPQIAAWF